MTELVITEEEAFELVVYLLSAAELTVFEPELYGSFRLVEAASRVLGPMLRHTRPERRLYYEQLKAELDQKKVWMMWDREAFLAFLQEMPGEVAKELKRRRANESGRAEGRG